MGIVRKVYASLKSEAEKNAAETRAIVADLKQSVDRMLAELPASGTTAAILPGLGKMLAVLDQGVCHVSADGAIADVPWEKFQDDLTGVVAKAEAQDLSLGKLMLDLLTAGLAYGATASTVTVAGKSYNLSFTDLMHLMTKIKAHKNVLELGLSEADISAPLKC